MTARILCVIAALGVTGAANAWVTRPEPQIERDPLATLTRTINARQGVDQPLDRKVVEVLGVDDLVNRTYFGSAGAPVSLYIGFYASQRTGQTIHSPLKCLPGTGWQPLATGVREIALGGPENGRRMTINRYLVQKGEERHVVLFWYQMRGHVVTSEYVAKLYLIDGALRTNRTDGALVRVIVPVERRRADGEAAADAEADAFVRELVPLLGSHLPA